MFSLIEGLFVTQILPASLVRRALPALTALALTAFAAQAATLDGVPVDVANKSEPVLCAEKDNVTLTLTSPEVRSFRIEAAHPAYIGALAMDRFAADWTACDMTGDPVFPAQPRRITFYESIDLWLVGYTFPGFWRPADVPFRVGDRVEHGLHLVQVWMLSKDRSEEVLVVYPPDGYWRARPLPPSHLRWSAYGSSFLVGPIEEAGRPVVKLKEIAFDPATRSFNLSFAQGGTARLAITKADDEAQVLDVTFDPPIQGKPFAALRSMYITEFNSDVARVAVRGPNSPGWEETTIMGFKGAKATDLWAGRLVPSRHNTSAPDMIFNGFSKSTKPAGRPTSDISENK